MTPCTRARSMQCGTHSVRCGAEHVRHVLPRWSSQRPCSLRGWGGTGAGSPGGRQRPRGRAASYASGASLPGRITAIGIGRLPDPGRPRDPLTESCEKLAQPHINLGTPFLAQSPSRVRYSITLPESPSEACILRGMKNVIWQRPSAPVSCT